MRPPSLSFTTFFISLCLPSMIMSYDLKPRWTSALSFLRRATRNVPPLGYYDPHARDNGSMLTVVANTFPAGLSEPINAILSGNSDAAVLVDQEINGGLRNYYLSLGFSGECLGQHAGGDQGANLGDGNGILNETAVIRWNYGDPALGSCTETIQGGNHFRYWVQNGKDADSGAIFMATSYEMPIAQGHDIIPNGYNLARDWLIGNATKQAVNTSSLINGTTFSGSTQNAGYTYQTDVVYVSGLLQNSSDGINHYLTVGVNGSNAIDGLVAVMTVKIASAPVGTKANAASSDYRASIPLLWLLLIFQYFLF